LQQKLIIKELGDEYEDLSQLNYFVPFSKGGSEEEILSFTND